MKEFREGVFKYGSLGLILLLPLIYINGMVFPQIAPKTFVLYGVVEVLAVVWFYSLLVDPTYRLSKKNLLFFVPVFAFLVWMTVAGLLATDSTLSFWSTYGRGTGLITWYHVLLFGLLTASLIKKEGVSYMYTFMKTAVTGSFFLALTIWIGNEGFNWSWRALQGAGGGGLMGNSSLAGAYLLFILFFIAILFTNKTVNQKGKWWRMITGLLIIFCPMFIDLHGFFSSTGILGSARGAFLGILVAIGTSILAYGIFSSKKVFRVAGITSAVVGVFTFIFLWIRLITPNSSLHEKFIQAASGTRFIFWDVATKAMEDHPWFGYGPENYMVAFQYHFHPEILRKENNIESWNDRAHNVFYDIGASSGYPSVALYTLLLLGILYSVYGAWKKKTLSQSQASLFVGLLIGYVFQNLFVFDSPTSLLILLTVIGMLAALNDEKPSLVPVRISNDNKVLLAGGFGLVGVFLVIMFCFRPAAEAVSYRTIFGMNITTRPDHYQDLHKGSDIGERWDVSGFAQTVYKTYAANPIQTKTDQKLLPLAEKDLSALLAYLETVRAKNTVDARLYISMAHLYSTEIYLTDTPNNPTLNAHILELLQHAHELSPTNPEIYWSMGQINVWGGNLKAAEQAYRDAIAIDPTLPVSHQLFIAYAQAIGDKKLYAEAVTNAKQSIPNFSVESK